jgi:CubicO group peptidase (beta-lactamase class C family)
MAHFDRRALLLLAAGGIAASAGLRPDRGEAAMTAARQAGEWPVAAPAEAGFAPDLEARIDALAADPRFGNLHSALVVRDGALVAERYYEGPDEAWGRPLGTRRFGPDDLHDLRSVSKSVVGLLYGIALAEGIVAPPDAPLLAQFPEYPDLADDPVRRRMTVGHALTMTLGTAWDEGLSYADPRNSEHAMELADDRYRYALDRSSVDEPGRKWTYNGGATALIGRLIVKGSGQSLHEYAESRLFGPLGIRASEWIRGRDGDCIAASGLRLRPRDLARIGRLALDGGGWQGERIVPADWLEASFRAHASAGELDYGYQWWLGPPAPDGRPGWVAGFGNGGQRLFLAPRLGLVVVVMAGNYNQPDAWKLPVAIITEAVLPALTRR